MIITADAHNQVDKKFADTIFDVLELGSTDFNQAVRPKYADGQPAHTVFLTQVSETYSGDVTPITTLRPIAWKSAIKEILWIYQDQSNSLDLLKEKYNIHWWDSWDVGDGTIGQRYGATVKKYQMMDNLLDGLKNNPYGRRHIMDLYQYQDFDDTDGLHPCAFMTLWSVGRDNTLDLTLVQRSSDFLVAKHINMVQYKALQMMVARHCGLKVGNFVHFVQNLHIYNRHIEKGIELISRFRNNAYNPQPKLILDTDKTDFYSFTIDDFRMENYHPIKPQMSFELGI